MHTGHGGRQHLSRSECTRMRDTGSPGVPCERAVNPGAVSPVLSTDAVIKVLKYRRHSSRTSGQR